MQAVTITVDQRGAVHGERLFDQKKRRGGGVRVTKVKSECAAAVTHWCLCRETDTEREKNDLRNTPTPLTGSRYPLH